MQAVKFEKAEKKTCVHCPNVRCKAFFSPGELSSSKIECTQCRLGARGSTILEWGRHDVKMQVEIESVPYELPLDLISERPEVELFLLSNTFDIEALNLKITQIHVAV